MNNKLASHLVHIFTASGALLAFWSMILISRDNAAGSIWVLALAAIIDSLDGTLARRFDVKTYTPRIDGALLDNLVDYLTWVFLPVVWAYMFLDVPFLIGSAVLITSLFGFSHTQSKTDDNFFRGFPSYWNFVILYLYALGAGATVSSIILLIFAFMVLVPIKFIYPSRTKKWQKLTLILFVPYSLLLLAMLIYLNETPLWITLVSFYYPVYYVLVSVLLPRREA
jgi:phosphatidylcholine synthase